MTAAPGPAADFRDRQDSGAGSRGGWQGRAFVLSAALLWSASGFFAKAPLFVGWPGPVLAFWRAAFACVLLVPCVRRPSWSLGLIPMVLTFALMNVTYLSAMAQAEASVAIWLQNTAPMWVFLVGVFALGEPVHPRDWGLLVLSALGVGLILFRELQGATPGAVVYGLASGVTYAGVMLWIRRLRHHDSAWLIALNHVGTALLLAPVAWLAPTWPQGWQWLFLAGFGMLQMGAPYFLFARGLRLIPSHQAASLALLEPLLVPVWVYVAWGREPSYQAPTPWTLAGGALILAGLSYRHFGGRRGA